MRTRFIVIEGLDGTGKSTITDDLAAALTRQGQPAIAIHTPEDDYRHITEFISERAEVDAQFLFFLSAVSYTSQRVAEQLKSTSVVCDRYVLSTLAYHRARGCSVNVSLESLSLTQPDQVFYLTVTDQAVRDRRIKSRRVVKPGDLLPLNGPLIREIDRQFRQSAVEVIDTTHLSKSEVMDAILQSLR